MSFLKSVVQYISVFVFILAQSSCEKEKPFRILVGKPMVVESKDLRPPIKSELIFKFNSLDLYQDISDLSLEQFRKYGTFYTSDFTIFHVNNLDLLEDNLYIVEIYLYFIDNTLHKIQAHTTKNMSDFFLSKYGGARLVLKDRFNKELVNTEGAISLRAGAYHMNTNLNNYKLKWKGADRLISYMVDESAQKNFEVIEELVDIENQDKIKVKPDYIFTIESDKYQHLLARVKLDELMARK
jgi:hypothetical protein